MTCKNCGSNRIAFIQAHSKDLSIFQCDHLNIDKDGYFPEIPGICSGDDATFDFCLECGMIQAEFPITDEVVKEAVRGDEDEDEMGSFPGFPGPEVVEMWAELMPSREQITFSNRSELLNHPTLLKVKQHPNFQQWMTSYYPTVGRYLAAALYNEKTENIEFVEVARIQQDAFNNYPEIDWTDYKKYTKR